MDPFIGELRMFAGSYAPAGWAHCDGQLLAITEHESLFNMIGTTYGGDGYETFALPDLRGRVPVGYGNAPGLSSYQLGQSFGVEQVTLTTQQLPSHRHLLLASTAGGVSSDPAGAVPASSPATAMWIRDAPTAPLPAETLAPTGGGQPHENRMPAVGISWIIAIHGIVPTS